MWSTIYFLREWLFQQKSGFFKNIAQYNHLSIIFDGGRNYWCGQLKSMVEFGDPATFPIAGNFAPGMWAKLPCVLISWKTCSWDTEQHQAMFQSEYDSWKGGGVAVLRDSLLSFGGVFLQYAIGDRSLNWVRSPVFELQICLRLYDQGQVI